MGHYSTKMILKLLLPLFIALQVQAHEVHLLGRLTPAGSFEISSKRLYGDIVYIKSKKTINAKRISVRTDTLDTGIDLRNEHLHKYLNAEKHPRIFIEKVEIKKWKGTGTISVNGVKKKISFNVKSNDKFFETSLELIPSQFKLKLASFMGVSVVDKVVINVKVNKEEIQ